MKRNIPAGIIAVITVLVHIFFFGGEEIQFADTVELKMPTNLTVLLDAADKKIVPVEVKVDTVIENADRLDLLGGLDFDAKIGDVLIFKKDDNKWIEIGRYLIQE